MLSQHNTNCNTVLKPSWLYWLWQVYSCFLTSEVVTGVKNTEGIHSGPDQNVREGTRDEAAVGGMQLQVLLCGSRQLSCYHFYIEATACPRVLCESKLLPRGRKMKRQLRVLYLYKYGQRQSVYSQGMDLAGVKCHSVHMGFFFVLGCDRGNTSTPTSPTPPFL